MQKSQSAWIGSAPGRPAVCGSAVIMKHVGLNVAADALHVMGVVHALAAPRPRTRYIVGADARANVAMARWLPDRVRDALLTWAMGLPRRAPDET